MITKILDNIIYIALALLLIIYTIQDLRYKKIQLLYGIIAIPFIFLGIILLDNKEITSRIFGLITGVIFYLFSVLSKEQLGKGDAILLTITGLSLGVWDNLCFIFISLLFTAIYSIIRIIIKGFRKKESIPLMPFLLLGYISLLLLKATN